MDSEPPPLFITYSGLAGGAERLLLGVLDGLEGAATLACPPGPLADAARATLEPIPGRPFELRSSPFAAGARLAAHARESLALVRRLRPRVVVAWGMRSALACAAALPFVRPRPRLVFAHNDLLPPGPVAAAVRTAARRADTVVALSHAIADDLRVTGTRVVPAGVDLEHFRPSAAPPERPRALVLGAIVGWKRPDLALDVAELVPDLEVELVGGPVDHAGERLAASLRERAARPPLSGRVTISGPLDDPRPALERASVLLHCAEREPFGLVLLEALACGRPVVAAASGGPLEIVDESCGRLYPPGDASLAADALREALAHSQELGAGARVRAEQTFDLRDHQRSWRELLAE